jgi:integrase
MYALQVGILLSAPIRLKNLNELSIGKSLIESGSGRHRQVRIQLTSDETKTHSNYSAPLSPRIYPVLDAWLSDYRSIVCDQPSTLLFPNSKGQLRSRESMSAKLARFVERETGLKVNTHLFRSLAAKIYLAHDPDGLEVVRQLLGHTSIKTTLKAYAELQTDPAFQRLEDALHTAGRGGSERRRQQRSNR